MKRLEALYALAKSRGDLAAMAILRGKIRAELSKWTQEELREAWGR